MLSSRYFNHSICILIAWGFISLILSSSLPYVIGPSLLDTVHSILLISSYGFMYLLPTTIVLSLLRKKAEFLQLITATIMLITTLSFIFFDGRLHDLYGFHFNGFVWNLLITPGGISSLQADQTSLSVVSKYIAILIGSLALCFYGAYRFKRIKVNWRLILALFFLLTLSERLIYGFAYANLNGAIMTQTENLIFYQPMKMNLLLSKTGYTVKKGDKNISINRPEKLNINYPLSDIRLNNIGKPYNILFLVAESMRSEDIFTERVMPHSVHFAKNYGSNFTHHYSGGNGTRQGLFAMFYGLYGSYWDSFLRAKQTPVLFDVLDKYSYEYFTYTAARFTYPEFDQTIFGSIPAEKLIETSDGEPWQRDQKNVSLLINDIEKRNRNKPFMGFVFFESTHARYSFPEDTALEADYLKKLDYAGLSKEELSPIIDSMKARYINACHYVDSQFKRVYDYLVVNNMLEDTIVIVTGDHGEEFMEKSHWGHNSSFVEEQVRVPMIASFPSKKPSIVTHMTSHLDISTTLLTTLGVSNPPFDYTLGKNLFSKTSPKMVVVASWSDLGLVTEQGKLVIPFKGTTQHQHLATSKDDTPIDLSDLTMALSSEIGHVVANSRRFVGKLKSVKRAQLLDKSTTVHAKTHQLGASAVKSE